MCKIWGEVSSSSLSLWVSYHSVFYKPLCQSLGYQLVTVATSLVGHLHERRSHAVTWPSSTWLGAEFWPRLLTCYWLEIGAPTNSLSTHFHSPPLFSLFSSSPSLLLLCISLSPPPLLLSQSCSTNTGIALHQHTATVTAWIHIWYFCFDGLYVRKTHVL